MRPVTNLKRHLADDSGFLLIIAMFVLLILSVLVATAIAVSSQTSTSTTRDGNSKAALEAAEAGLQVAAFRLSKLEPGEAQCITGESKVTLTGAEVYCAGSAKEAFGNGATFQYWTSKALAAGAKCAGEPIPPIKSGTTVRCITSEGQVHGVTPGTRLQTPVTAAEESLFSIQGILGLKEVKITGSVAIPAVVASNEKIVGEGSADFERGFELCPPNGSFTPKAGTERNASGVKVGGVGGMLANPPLEKTRSAGPPECLIKAPLSTIHATAASNEDSRIGVADKLEGKHHTWNEAKYEFKIEGSEKEDKLTLGEAGRTTKYFFCKFTMGPKGSAQLKIPVGAKVEIFIGSPEETPKVCEAGTGTFEIAGGSQTENEGKNPGALVIKMGGKGPFTYANGSGKTLEASIYAPDAQVHLEGGVKFNGGIVGEDVYVENGTSYEWSEATGLVGNGEPSAYARKAWEQCSTGSGATEGC